jgi:hypothetical protein
MLTAKATQQRTSFQVFMVVNAQIVVTRSVMCSLVDGCGDIRGTQSERAVYHYSILPYLPAIAVL